MRRTAAGGTLRAHARSVNREEWGAMSGPITTDYLDDEGDDASVSVASPDEDAAEAPSNAVTPDDGAAEAPNTEHPE